MKYSTLIQLNTAKQLPSKCSIMVPLTVKEYGPTNITHTHMHNGEWVAMEYGIAENEEFPLIVLLKGT